MNNEGAGGRARPKRASRNRTGGGSAKARRKAARLAAVQALYQIDLTGGAGQGVAPDSARVETVVGEFVKHRLGGEIDGVACVPPDPQVFADVVRGAAHRRAEVDPLLAAALAPRHSLDRIEALLRAILRAGGYELFANAGTHPRVLINEYVDVAHAFFGGREPGMVNGVLDHVARALRPDELAASPDSPP